MTILQCTIGSATVNFVRLPECANIKDIEQLLTSFSGNLAVATIDVPARTAIVDFNLLSTALETAETLQSLDPLLALFDGSMFAFIPNQVKASVDQLLVAMTSETRKLTDSGIALKQNQKFDSLSKFLVQSAPVTLVASTMFLDGIHAVIERQGQLHILPVYS